MHRTEIAEINMKKTGGLQGGVNDGKGGLRSKGAKSSDSPDSEESKIPPYNKDSPWNCAPTLEEFAPKLLDLVGKKSKKVTVISRLQNTVSKSRSGETREYDRWECKCECGNIFPVSGMNWRSKPPKSCGCNLYPGHRSYRAPGSQTTPLSPSK